MELYKFMPAHLALKCLPACGDGALRATQPLSLNDPYESFVRTLNMDRDVASMDRELAASLHRIVRGARVDGEAIERARHDYGSNYLRQLFARQLSYRYGIVSFAEAAGNPLMWTHYAEEGSGVVVGYDAGEVGAALPGTAALHQVHYVAKPVLWDYPAVAEHPEIALSIMCSKGRPWRYEREWRIVAELKDTIGTENCDRYGMRVRLLRMPNKAVRSVFYTDRTPPKVVADLGTRLGCAASGYVAARVSRMVLADETFEYREAEG